MRKVKLIVHETYQGKLKTEDVFAAVFLSDTAGYAKKIIKWLKSFVDGILKFYTGLSPRDISAIAKDIKRSPHRVRQALQSLNKRFSKVYTRLGKIARAISLICLVASVAYSLASGVKIFDIIAENIITGFVDLLKWLVGEGLKKLVSLIPAIGIFLGFCIGKLIGIALNAIFSKNYVKKVTQKYINSVNHKTYNAWDYFATFFKCLV